MFQYFPSNYVWSLSVNIALEMGVAMGEIDAICRPLLDVAKQGDDEGTATFFRAWRDMGDQLSELAAEDEQAGRLLSAGAKLNRAAAIYLVAERMHAHGLPERTAIYQKGIESFLRGVALSREPCRRVEIPYGDKHIVGLFVAAENAGSVTPCVVHINGLDSLKEMLYRCGHTAQELSRRGIASLIIDQPGTGEALRLGGMVAVAESEHWAAAIVDFLETEPGVDAKRIGLLGVSLGGYYAPRAVAFEPRFALGVVWGANHNWGEIQRRRRQREGENPVPHYWEHVKWVWGAKDVEEFMMISEKVTLDGVLDRIRVPFLVTHGEKDRQIPLHYAHQTYDALVNSSKRELKIFTDREQGVEHSSLDNLQNARDCIVDWIAETFGTATA